MSRPRAVRRTPPGRGRVPLSIKIGYSLFLGLLVPAYWQAYGPGNFLWLCDVALFVLFAGLWLESPLLVGMVAIGAVPFQLAWTVDLLAGARLLGMAAFMFDPALPPALRALSLFHAALPPLVGFLLWRLGYDRRALLAQSVLVWLLLPASYLLGDPGTNVNLVFGAGPLPPGALPPLIYLALEMVLLPLAVLLPGHLLARRLFPRP